MELVIENQNNYRIAWRNTLKGVVGKGTFLFNDPSEARDTIVALKREYPTFQYWLEDHDGKKVDIPPR